MDKVVTFSLQDNFIENLNQYILQNFGKNDHDLGRLAVIFGGKRPALFVKRDLAKALKTSFYSPRFFTMDEWITYICRKKDIFKKTVDLDNCYLLYQLAQKVAPQILKGRETFSQFLPWTREILSFIDHLDLERVENEDLRNVEQNARIGYPVPNDINQLLETIVVLRRAYHHALINNGCHSRGLQYFRAAENISEVTFDEFDQILFCNLFYCHRSEEVVIRNLFERDLATLIFQGDACRWPVLKRMATHFSLDIKEGREPMSPKFDLKLYRGFDVHSQVTLVCEILSTIKNKDKTVIVLPDSDHLIPLLSVITNIVGEFNVSMGYPLKRSSLFTLFQLVFRAQLSKKENRYYAKDYLKVLQHPFVKNLKGASKPVVTRILIHKIEEMLTGNIRTRISGSLFITLKDIETLDDLFIMGQEMLNRMGYKVSKHALSQTLKEIHDAFFRIWEDIQTFQNLGKTIAKILDVLVHKSFLGRYPLNNNIVLRIMELQEEIVNASFQNEMFHQEEIFKIFESKISQEFVAFQGQPLSGLQILGLQETRSLNFDDVIVMDVNEGIMPKLRIYEPLIPREVMISLNLDRLELEEEIQRYQFMRLIASAQKVHLVYQESKDKEKSRFVEELNWEEQKRKGQCQDIFVKQGCFDIKISQHRTRIKKTPMMLKALRQHKFSASSINTYLRDPIEFYYTYILALREQEDLLDEPEARHVGTFIHELLEQCFLPFLNKKPSINASFRKKFFQHFDQRFDESFGRSMKSSSFLLKAVMTERLNRFLDNEEQNEHRQIDKILYLENQFQDTIDLSVGKIKFQYVVDRIDKYRDGTIMIIDYKTGGIDQMPKSIDQIESMELSRESIKDNIKSFQIPLYFHYLQNHFQGQPINAAFYNLRTLDFHKFIDQKKNFLLARIEEAFMRALDYIMSEILDPSVCFEEVDKS